MSAPQQPSQKTFSLSSEIGAMFLLLGLLPLFLIGWQYNRGAETQLYEEISTNLIALADSRAERFESFAQESLRQVQVLANSPLVIQAMQRLSYRDQALGKLGKDLETYRENIAASDLFIISADGEIQFAAVQKSMERRNIADPTAPFKLLANAFDRARTLLEPHNSDFTLDESANIPTGFVAAPVLKSGRVLGVVALRLSQSEIYRIIGDYSGLGHTGETLVAGQEGSGVRLIGPLRFGESFSGQLDGVIEGFLQKGLSGERDVGFAQDYRTKQVICAWRHVPSFRWALLVKVDVDERLAPIKRLRNMGVIFLSVMALLIIAVSVLMARAITTPISQLESAARDLANGNSAQVVPERGAWEINSLAQAFNSMSERIHAYQTGLRRMVDERTTELRHAKDVAERATRAKSDFLAMISHEIRTPLNGLLGMAELLKTQDMGPLARDYVHTLHQSGVSLSDLLNDLLDISRIEAGKLDLESRAFAPTTLVQGLSALMKRSAELKGLSYQLDLSADLPKTVLGDPARLRQILLNLTGNAIKFTAEGQITLAVSVIRLAQNECELSFEVRDTGIGIPLDEQHKLFQPFSQLGEGRSKQYGGAGLGLAISQRLAQRMGGEITLQSQDGEGACFRVTLPFDIAATDLHLAEETIPATLPMRVLIVEDEPINRRVLAGLLRRDGHEVLSTSSGEEALQVLHSEPVDVVLSDLRLPGICGYDVIETVSRDWKIPAIAVTANLMPEDVSACLEAGASDVIAKPIVLNALRQALSKIARQENPTVIPSAPQTSPTAIAQPLEGIFRPDYLDDLADALAWPAVESLLSKAEASVHQHLANLAKAILDQDEAAKADHAHKLAGVSGTYGLQALRAKAKDIERSPISDLSPATISQLSDLAQRSLQQMNEWAAQNKV